MIKKVVLDKSDRLYHFPFDLEECLPRQTIPRKETKVPVIDLARFRWLPNMKFLSDSVSAARPAKKDDLTDLKKILAQWLADELGIKALPYKELYIGQGIRRTVFDLCLAFVEHGDMVLCPEPGMPFYKKMVIATGGVPVSYPISINSDYKPSQKIISSNLGKTARIMFLNNPHNPTGIVLDKTDLTSLVRLLSKMNIFLVNDAAYCSLAEEKYFSPLTIPGGNKVCLEMFSIPFTFGLPYIPFGFAVGPAETIKGLEISGKTLGATIPLAWIEETVAAIEKYPSENLKTARRNIAESRHEAESVVDKYGWEIVGGKSAPFLWIKIPGRRQAGTLAQTLLRRKGLLVYPGNAFGDTGAGYFRLSLTASAEDYKTAGQRLQAGTSLIKRRK